MVGWIKLFGNRFAHSVCSAEGKLVRARCGLYLNRRFVERALDTDKHCKACGQRN
jgi:hypothetical protein